ncbi:hypothetical protein Ccrd_022263 [Cynara cardunculus var. scolymus]|uniref:Uncharacterized protein n=1 Tax=Cynara cardunculus var. scolymus TaxID=59895 RepID=A0A118JZ48_CYNCS|nr:hypothetical protein Ccrd_022263 [Cynara cardunculus var. scolymus]
MDVNHMDLTDRLDQMERSISSVTNVREMVEIALFSAQNVNKHYSVPNASTNGTLNSQKKILQKYVPFVVETAITTCAYA